MTKHLPTIKVVPQDSSELLIPVDTRAPVELSNMLDVGMLRENDRSQDCIVVLSGPTPDGKRTAAMRTTLGTLRFIVKTLESAL